MHGIVIRNTGNSYVVRTDDGQEVECKVKGNFRLRGIRSTSPVAVGDGVTVMKSTEKATSKTSGKKGKGRKKNKTADSGEFQVEHDETRKSTTGGTTSSEKHPTSRSRATFWRPTSTWHCSS